MNDPPDPGGFVPPASNFVTIVSNESGMETDSSISNRALKRKSRGHVSICKLCNKRRRKHGSESRPSDCDCEQNIHTSIDQQKIPPSVITKHNDATSPTFIPTQIGRKLYEKTDIAPYLVHVQQSQLNPNDGTSIHPMSFGKFLKKYSFKNIINGSVKKIGRNKVCLSFSNFNDANNFINHTSLEAHNFRAFIPTFNVTRMGIVRGIPADWSPEEVKENMSVPIGCGEILKIRRLNYKSFVDGTPQWKPSHTVVLTFDGQVLPKRIFCCFNALSVDLYIYPTIQCFNCCRFGHTRIQCRSKPRCYKCGKDHSGDSCEVIEENASCCSCLGLHFATNKKCPEYVRQTQIKSYMAQNCVSYVEASKLHPPITKSYVEALTTSPTIKDSSNINFTLNRAVSYKKTLTLKPKAHKPYSSKGYDKAAHDAIINEHSFPQVPSNNGVLNGQQNEKSDFQVPNDFVTALLGLLSHFNIRLPSNDAPLYASNIQSSQYDSTTNTTVEL